MERSRASAVMLAFVFLLGGCGGGSSLSGSTCAPGIGLGAPPCPCSSWSFVIQLGGFCSSACVSPKPDFSFTPARVTVRVGQRFTVSSYLDAEHPEGCNQGYSRVPSAWSATVPTVLALESVHDSGIATFAARSPGVTTIVADGLRLPSGAVGTFGLSACAEERSAGLQYQCLRRVPVEVVVVP